MAKRDFVHLHNHTMYSLLDGAIRPEQMIEKAVEYNMPAVAITDHGNLFGAVKFYKQAKEAELNPIIGSEIYVAVEGRFKRKPAWGINDGAIHLTLLAENNAGYKNIMKLVSKGYLEGFYYHPRVDKELLKEYSEGIIALSGCTKGEIAHLILKEDFEGAKNASLEYDQIFGHGNFFFEVQRHNIQQEEKINEVLVDLSSQLDIPLVATNDCHYLHKKDASAHEVLLCIQTGKTLEDENRIGFQTNEFYFKSPQQMSKIFEDLPEEASENTLKIAERCSVKLQFGQPKLPYFPIPAGYKNSTQYLRHLSWKGVEERYETVTQQVQQRLEHELKIIEQMGYSDYFLIVEDFVRYAKENKILVGPGRGSATGSLVAYVLKITDVDPLENDLLFERFLNPERGSSPDIDIDFADRDRQKVIDYVVGKYGTDNVSQIITFGTMAARAVIRDVGRVLNMPYGDVDRIAKLIPFGVSLEKAIQTTPELTQLASSDDLHSKLISYARTLVGLARHASTHAAGIVIAPGKLTDYVPLCKTSKDEVTTQYEMESLEEIGLLKIDFLGLRTLTVIDDTLKLISKRESPPDIDNLPLDDERTFKLLAEGKTVGIFQFESAGMRDYLRRLKPNSIEDMIAMNALYRPGPMASIDEYIRRKHRKSKVTYEHPKLEPILEPTYGIIVYQEQVMRIASELAGFSLAQADLLRRAMGKKKPEVMLEQKESFIKGCFQRGIPEKKAENIFNSMSQFAGYGFNRSHSAGYALIAYKTAYLKAHWPHEFMAANLTSEMENSDRIAILIGECRKMGIDVLSPDVNESQAYFTVTPKGIRFGLKAIKNVGIETIKAIINAREKNGKFDTIFDFCKRVDHRHLSKKALESLIASGAMDSLKGHRAQLMASLDQALEKAQSAQVEKELGQMSLLSNLPEEEGEDLPDVPQWDRTQALAKEKQVLGLYVSGHPLDKYAQDLEKATTHYLGTLSEAKDGAKVTVGGIITNVKTTMDRKGQRMAFVGLEDFSGSAESIVFSSLYEQYRTSITPDKIVLIRGRASVQENGNAKVISDEIIPLQDFKRQSKTRINISLSAAGLKEETLQKLKKTLKKFPGKCEVLIHIETIKAEDYHSSTTPQKVSIKSKDIFVSPSSEALSKLKEIVGPGKVWLE